MKNKSSNEKIAIYLIIFFMLLLVVILVLYFLGIIGRKEDTVDVVLNKDIIIQFSNDKWNEVQKKDYSNYNWNKYYVYEDGKKKNNIKYSVYYSEDKFYLFEEKNNSRTPAISTEESIYLGGTKKAKYIEFDKRQFDDDDIKYINSIFKSNGISTSDYDTYIIGYKVVYDFDNDDKDEEMYVLSNVFSYRIVNSAYSLIFIKDDNNTKFIYKNIKNKINRYDMCCSRLLGILKIDGVSSDQIVTKCSYYDNSKESEYGIYQGRYKSYQLLLYIK